MEIGGKDKGRIKKKSLVKKVPRNEFVQMNLKKGSVVFYASYYVPLYA